MTLCPGKQGQSLYDATWERDLDMDIIAIKEWGAVSLVTLMELQELSLFGVPGLGDAARRAGLNWLHLPIRDGEVPDTRFDKLWPDVAASLLRELGAGQRVVIHCRGGLGRTGLVSGMLLVELGEIPGKALYRVRKSRPGAVETTEQERYLMYYRPIVYNLKTSAKPDLPSSGD